MQYLRKPTLRFGAAPVSPGVLSAVFAFFGGGLTAPSAVRLVPTILCQYAELLLLILYRVPCELRQFGATGRSAIGKTETSCPYKADVLSTVDVTRFEC